MAVKPSRDGYDMVLPRSAKCNVLKVRSSFCSPFRAVFWAADYGVLAADWKTPAADGELLTALKTIQAFDRVRHVFSDLGWRPLGHRDTYVYICILQYIIMYMYIYNYVCIYI